MSSTNTVLKLTQFQELARTLSLAWQDSLKACLNFKFLEKIFEFRVKCSIREDFLFQSHLFSVAKVHYRKT